MLAKLLRSRQVMHLSIFFVHIVSICYMYLGLTMLYYFSYWIGVIMINFLKGKAKHIFVFLVSGVIGILHVSGYFPVIEEILKPKVSQQQKTSLLPNTPNNNGNQITAPIHATGNVTITQEIHKPVSEEHKRIDELLNSLNEIEQLYPYNAPLQNCMKTQQNYIKSILDLNKQANESFFVFGNCLRQLQTQFLSGLGKLDKHQPTLEKIYNNNPEVKGYVEDLEYFMGEIDNNHLAYYIWSNRGCSNEVKYILYSLDEIDSECVMGITNHEDFVKQMQKEYIDGNISYTDITGMVQARDMNGKRDFIVVNNDLKLPEQVEVINSSTVEDFFVKQNLHSYSKIKENVNGIRKILFDIQKAIGD